MQRAQGLGDQVLWEDRLPVPVSKPWWSLSWVLSPRIPEPKVRAHPFLLFISWPRRKAGPLVVGGLGKWDPMHSGAMAPMLLRLGTGLACHLAALASPILHVRLPPGCLFPQLSGPLMHPSGCHQASLGWGLRHGVHGAPGGFKVTHEGCRVISGRERSEGLGALRRKPPLPLALEAQVWKSQCVREAEPSAKDQVSTAPPSLARAPLTARPRQVPAHGQGRAG